MKLARMLRTILILQSPSMRREWIEIAVRISADTNNTSPSMRREWIEIGSVDAYVKSLLTVSLHAEGVD